MQTVAVGEPLIGVEVPDREGCNDARSGPRVSIWVAPVLVGLAVRIAHWVVVSPDWVPRSDARQYVEIARSIASGGGFAARFPSGIPHPTAFRPPLYPTLLALPMRVFGPGALWPGRLLSILIGLGVIALTVTYTRRIAGDRAGLVAGLAVAVLPSLVANDTVTLSEPLGLALSLAVLLVLLDDRALLAGGLTGLLLLTRPNAYLVLLVVAVALWRSVGWRRAFVALGTCAVVVAPWVLRNAVVVGTPKLVTSDGFTLAAIYGPPALDSGGFTDPTVDRWYRHAGIQDLQGDESAWSDALTGAALDGVRSRPSVVVEHAVEGAATMLELPGHRAWAAELVDGRDPRLRDATLFVLPLLVGAGMAGTLLRIRDRRTWPAVAVVAGFASVSLVTVSVPRLRGPFDLLMCIGVGYLAAWIPPRSVPSSGLYRSWPWNKAVVSRELGFGTDTAAERREEDSMIVRRARMRRPARGAVRVLVGPVLAAMALVLTSCLGPVQKVTADAPRLPETSDPFVLAWQGQYFVYGSDNHLRAPVTVLTDISRAYSLTEKNARTVEGMPTKPPWAARAHQLWAPTVARFGDRWIMYFAADRIAPSDPANPQCIGRAFASSPSGPFTPEAAPMICGQNDHGALDPDVFTDAEGRRWLYAALGDTDTPIWAFALDANGWKLDAGIPVLGRRYPWEYHFIENPSMAYDPIRRNYLLAYSAGVWYEPGYSTGIARCVTPAGPCTSDPTGPWLASSNGRTGTGGLSFFTDLEGSTRAIYSSFPAGGESQNGGRSASIAYLKVDPAVTLTVVK